MKDLCIWNTGKDYQFIWLMKNKNQVSFWQLEIWGAIHQIPPLNNLHLTGDCSRTDRVDADMSHIDSGPNYNYKDWARIYVLGSQLFLAIKSVLRVSR